MKRILIVEDHEGWEKVLTADVKSLVADADVVVKNDYPNGLNALAEKWDLLIADIGLNHKDGEDRSGIALVELAKEKGVPAIVVTVQKLTAQEFNRLKVPVLGKQPHYEKSAFAKAVREVMLLEQPDRKNSGHSSNNSSGEFHELSESPCVLLFTALREEREVLERTFQLRTEFEDGVARGSHHSISLELICGDHMGRVPAAVAIASHLAQCGHPISAVIVAGLAGGFGEANIQQGAVIIADEIIDLATRKQNAENVQFRPRVFKTSNLLERYVHSRAFNEHEWEQHLLQTLEWPTGRRPSLHFGPLASVDEVVSSNSWRQELIKAWPKLLGVEMEAGGACAGAERFGRRVVVVRGVSDLADPRKSDDVWRPLAIKAVAALIKRMLDSDVVRHELSKASLNGDR